MSYRILVINPGSTSTKIGVYEDEQLLFDKTLRHSAEDIAQFNTIAAQKDWRRDLVMRALREQGIDARTLLAVAILGLTANLLGVQLLGVILVGRTAGFSGTEEHGFFAVGIVLMFMIAFHNNQLLAAVSPSPSGNGGNSCPLPSAGFLLAKNLRANDTAGEAPPERAPKGRALC